MTQNIFPPCKATEALSPVRCAASADAARYLSALINQPWTRDGRHCWRLVREVQRELFGRELPIVLAAAPPPGKAGRTMRARLFAEHEERGRWREIEKPAHGAIVLMRSCAAPEGFFIHSGVYLSIDVGGVLHTADPHGVVFDSLIELAARRWRPAFFVPA